jgi:hypothetical protein
MKLSKIGIGLGTAVLAGIGAFASAKTFAPQPYWYKASATAPCTSTTVAFNCTIGGTGCLGTQGTAVGKQLFLTNKCQIPLKTI